MKTAGIFLMLLLVLDAQSQFTREEAIEIIIDEVVGPDSIEIHHLFSKYSKMYEGDTLWMDGPSDYYICPFPEN